MAVARFSDGKMTIHGRLGNYIFYNACGVQYIRAHAMPVNRRTVAQQANRKSFAEAVKAWRQLPEPEKHFITGFHRTGPSQAITCSYPCTGGA